MSDQLAELNLLAWKDIERKSHRRDEIREAFIERYADEAIERAKAAYVADEIDVVEFEWACWMALHGIDSVYANEQLRDLRSR